MFAHSPIISSRGKSQITTRSAQGRVEISPLRWTFTRYLVRAARTRRSSSPCSVVMHSYAYIYNPLTTCWIHVSQRLRTSKCSASIISKTRPRGRSFASSRLRHYFPHSRIMFVKRRSALLTSIALDN